MRRTAASMSASVIQPLARASWAPSKKPGVAITMSLPARTATAAASASSAQILCSQTMRPTLSQSVTSVPVKPHSSFRTSLSSHELAVMGTPSIDW